MLAIEEVKAIKIETLDEGRGWVAIINEQIKQVINDMQGLDDNKAWQVLVDEHYELKKFRRNIQSQMAKIVRNRK